jgi:hypothetical protein
LKAAQYFGPSVTDLYNATKNCLDETGVVDGFLEGSVVLMKLLDEIKNIHPFIGGVLERSLLTAHADGVG